MSLIFILMSLRSIWHVDLKKSLCRRVEFKGQGPQGEQFKSRKSSSSDNPVRGYLNAASCSTTPPGGAGVV